MGFKEEKLQKFFEQERQTAIQRFRILNQSVIKGETLFTGSSLMEQFPINELIMTYGMPYIIYNRGIGGFTTDDMLNHMDEMVFGTEPSRIFINIGTNDMGASDYQLKKLINNYEKIILRTRERLPNVKIFILAYYPMTDSEDAKMPEWIKETISTRNNENLIRANKELEKMAAKMNCDFIDANEGLTDENDCLKKEFTVEGIHMYANAYRVIFENLRKYLS